jgi:hypothetical protein
MKKVSILLEHINKNYDFLVEAYSKDIVDKLVTKFKAQADAFNIPDITDEKLKKYIEFFDKLRQSGAVTPSDITQYDLDDLIRVVTSKKKFAPEEDEPNTNFSDVAYQSEDGSITAWNGARQENCVRYGVDQPEGTSSRNRWCITQPGGSYWGTYRYGADYGYPTFYLIKNRNLPASDPLSFVAVQILQNGEYRYTNRENRPGMSDRMSWSQLNQEIPWLSEIPNLRNIIKWIPFTPEEERQRRIKPSKLDYNQWLVLPVNQKLKYLTKYKGDDRPFTDLSMGAFLSKKLPGNNLKDVAEEIARTYGVLDLNDLLNYIDFFTPTNQRSILHQLTNREEGNVRQKINIKSLASPDLPFSIKKEITRNKIWDTSSEGGDVYLVNDKLGNEIIVRVVINPSDGKISMGVYKDGGSYPSVAINKTTAQLLLAYPDLDKIPFKTALDLFKDGVVGRAFINKIIEKAKEDPDSAITLQTLENGNQIIIDGNTFTAWKLEGNAIESIPFNSEEAQAALAASENSDGLKRAAYDLIKNGSIIPSTIDKEPFFNLLRALPYAERTGFDGDNSLVLIVGDRLFWVSNTELFAAPSAENGYGRNNWRSFDRYEPLTEGDWAAYFEYLRSKNATYNDTALENMLDATGYGYARGMDAKRMFINNNPPLNPANNFRPVLITKNGEEIPTLINLRNPSDSRAVGKRGSLIRASIPPALARQLVGAAQPEAPAAGPAAAGAAEPARRGRRPGGQNVAAPQPAAAAGADANAGTEFITAIGGLPEYGQALATSFDGLPIWAKRPLTRVNAVPMNNDRGASRRNNLLRGAGRVIGVFESVNTPSKAYVIRLASGLIVVSIVIQPGNAHLIMRPNGGFIRLMDPSTLAATLQQNNLNEELTEVAVRLHMAHDPSMIKKP